MLSWALVLGCSSGPGLGLEPSLLVNIPVGLVLDRFPHIGYLRLATGAPSYSDASA